MNPQLTPVPSQIGEPIPRSDRHAVSVCLPTWESTLAWARKDAKVVEQMQIGYPRFFVHPLVEELAYKVIRLYQDPENCKGLVFPTIEIAQRCREWIAKKATTPPSQDDITIISLPKYDFDEIDKPYGPFSALWDLHVIVVPTKLYSRLRAFWQHTGEGISSRRAEYCLKLLAEGFLQNGALSSEPIDNGDSAKTRIREEVAKSFSSTTSVISSSDIFLYASGMKAIYEVYRALLETPKAKTALTVVAFGFTYVDTFKILEGFGPL